MMTYPPFWLYSSDKETLLQSIEDITLKFVKGELGMSGRLLESVDVEPILHWWNGQFTAKVTLGISDDWSFEGSTIYTLSTLNQPCINSYASMSQLRLQSSH